ncbi:hypothetical protein AAFC00_003076 [Neodothiora populina]
MALAAQYAHPLEYLMSSVLPFEIPARLLKMHIVTYWIFLSGATLVTVVAHSGYDIFAGLSLRHDLHHEMNTVNFGTLGFLDRIHGTGYTPSSRKQR